MRRREMLGGLCLAPFTSLISGPAHAAGTENEPEPHEVAVDVRSFGAKGNGRANDTAAFRLMHSHLRGLQSENDAARSADPRIPPLRFRIDLPPGHYSYTWNRWTWGLRRVIVNGYGATIRCTAESAFDMEQAPLLSNRSHYEIWDGRGLVYGQPNPTPEDFGYLIRTARPGDEAVTLIGNRVTGLFRPGMWVLVQSYAQQHYGYPPNVRYFERARLVAIDGHKLRLDRPLRYLHRDDWPEDPREMTSTGRARVVAIDRPDCPFALEQAFLGLTVATNPNHHRADPEERVNTECLTVSGVLKAEVRDCKLIAFVPSMCGYVRLSNCSVVYSEVDKVIDELLVENCTIRSLQQSTGVNRVTVRNTLIQGNAQINSREALVEDCRFGEAAGPSGVRQGLNLQGPNPTRHLELRRCQFNGDGAEDSVALSRPDWVAATAGRDGVSLLDGRTLSVPITHSLFRPLVDLLEEGWPVLVVRTGGDVFAGTCGVIRGDGKTALFTFDTPKPIETGDRIEIPRLLSLSVTGCTFTGLKAEPPYAPRLDWQGRVTGSRRFHLSLSSADTVEDTWIPGVLRDITVDVTKVYRGPAAGRYLVMVERLPQPRHTLLAIDLFVAGRRRLTPNSAEIASTDVVEIAGQRATRIPSGRYFGQLDCWFAERPDAGPLGTRDAPSAAAMVKVEFEISSPLTSLADRRLAMTPR